jgi:hypothetical protein
MARRRSKSVKFGADDFSAWETADGQVIPIKDMDSTHLENAIGWIQKTGKRRGYLDKLQAELARRDNDAGTPPGMGQEETAADPWDGPLVMRRTVVVPEEEVEERPDVDPDLDDLLDDVF